MPADQQTPSHDRYHPGVPGHRPGRVRSAPRRSAAPTDSGGAADRGVRRRVAERAEPRVEHEETLASSGSLAELNPPELVARRLDRLTRFYAGDELPSTTPTEAPERLPERPSSAPPCPTRRRPSELLEAIINTADFVGTRYLDAGVAAARAVGPHPRQRRHRTTLGLRHRVDDLAAADADQPSRLRQRAQAAATSHVEFNYQDGIDGKMLQVTTFGFDPGRFFLADEDLDFAIVAVRARAEELAPFGFNRLIESEGKALLGEFVTIVQHPRGEKKQVALRENRIVDGVQRFLHYTADTEPGSSGSPVFNDQWEVVALHHASVRAPEHPSSGSVLNEGVRCRRSCARSGRQLPPTAGIGRQILRRHAEPNPAVAPSPPLRVADLEVKIPLTLNLTLPPGVAAIRSSGRQSSGWPRAGPRAPSRSTRTTAPAAATTRRSLAFRCRCPTAGRWRRSRVTGPLRYHHFSVVMHRRRRKLALFTAVNIDGERVDSLRRESDVLDPRSAACPRTNRPARRSTARRILDRGHLVRRLDPAWGPAVGGRGRRHVPLHQLHAATSRIQRRPDPLAGTGGLRPEQHGECRPRGQRVQRAGARRRRSRVRGVSLPRQYWKTVAMVQQRTAKAVCHRVSAQPERRCSRSSAPSGHRAHCRRRSPSAHIGRSRSRSGGSPVSPAWIWTATSRPTRWSVSKPPDCHANS